MQVLANNVGHEFVISKYISQLTHQYTLTAHNVVYQLCLIKLVKSLKGWVMKSALSCFPFCLFAS